MSNGTKAEIGAERILYVFKDRADRPGYGLMQHEFVARFRSDGWTIADFKAAMQLAFDEGWIEINAQFYRLTEDGERKLKAKSARLL